MNERNYTTDDGFIPVDFDPEEIDFSRADPKVNARELAAYIRGWKTLILAREDMHDGTAWDCFDHASFWFLTLSDSDEQEAAKRARDEQDIDDWRKLPWGFWNFVEYT